MSCSLWKGWRSSAYYPPLWSNLSFCAYILKFMNSYPVSNKYVYSAFVLKTNHVNQNFQQVVSAAAEKLEQRRRGWTTEEDKKMKIFNLPKVNKAFFNSSSYFESSYDMDFSLCYVISSCDLFEESCTGCRLILEYDSCSDLFPSLRKFICHTLTFVWRGRGGGWVGFHF